MRFEFDPSKDAANRAKHGVPLMFGARVFEDAQYVILASIRPIDGEDRRPSAALDRNYGLRFMLNAARRAADFGSKEQ